MKLVAAPDSFKGALSSATAAEVMCSAWSSVFQQAECLALPVADGGEGSIAALQSLPGFETAFIDTLDACGQPVAIPALVNNSRKEVYIETASIIGLPHVPVEKRRGGALSTFGVGRALEVALKQHGAKRIGLFLGGSSTTDGGVGALEALGVAFFGEKRKPLESLTGLDLLNLRELDGETLVSVWGNVQLDLISDVSCPLLGPEGTVQNFGKQKGLEEGDEKALEEGLLSFAEKLEQEISRPNLRTIPGVGAAGGLAFGLSALPNSKVYSGFDYLADKLQLRKHFIGCDLVLTGEGSFDRQSKAGKVPVGIGRLAKEIGVPVIVCAGQVDPQWQPDEKDGIIAAYSIVPGPGTLEEAIASTKENLYRTVQGLAHIFRHLQS